MQWLNDYRMRLISVGIVAAIVFSGGNAKADFIFGTPINLGPTVNSSARDYRPIISPDGLELYFGSRRPGGYGATDLWVATRTTKDDPWGEPVNLGPLLNTGEDDMVGSISSDCLNLYFDSRWRTGGYGERDIYVTTRATTADDWGSPVNLGPTVNSQSPESRPTISADGLELFFFSDRPGGYGHYDLWVTTRAMVDDAWGPPKNLGSEVNTGNAEFGTSISADGRILLFGGHNWPNGYGDVDLWITRRATKDDLWGPPKNLGPAINTSSAESYPSLSADGRTLYFCDYGTIQRPGGYGSEDLWQVPIISIVDFNGDGIVDATDMCIMVDHWGTDESLCDIGPMPWGDGVVDVQDLIVLAEHLFEEVNDPTLVAHWALDEAEGGTAHDSVSGNDDYVIGNPLWQPTGGMVDGALELDGVDDCLVTTFGVNPAEGSFSIFAWVKGGAPGQIVISEPMGADWLAVDAEGKLMTDLKSPGRGAAALMSQTVIADGVWHRIGLVWDGSQRMLCVDGVTVAEDTQNGLEASAGGLYIGTGKAMEPGTYFSGLIDDIRIYDRAVKP